MAFIYRPDNGVTLSPSQAEFLESIENKPSPFQGLTSLKDLRSLTGLSVVVTDRERLREILFNAKEATYSKIAEDHWASNLAEKDIHDRQIWIEEHLNPESPDLSWAYTRGNFFGLTVMRRRFTCLQTTSRLVQARRGTARSMFLVLCLSMK